MPDQSEVETDLFSTVPFPREMFEGLLAMRDHYWARSNTALDDHDADAFTMWNRRAKQITSVIGTAQEVWIRDREAWVAAQTARLTARNGAAAAGDE